MKQVILDGIIFGGKVYHLCECTDDDPYVCADCDLIHLCDENSCKCVSFFGANAVGKHFKLIKNLRVYA